MVARVCEICDAVAGEIGDDVRSGARRSDIPLVYEEGNTNGDKRKTGILSAFVGCGDKRSKYAGLCHMLSMEECKGNG